MSRSVPEKTLEHWASIYLAYRFRSHVGLWWPTLGEDIDILHLPSRPGKALQLEMKTVEAKAETHTLHIDASQLRTYMAKPSWQQPFYVFPWPWWTGEFRKALVTRGVAETEAGFSRVDQLLPNAWFANWLVVMAAKDVSAILASDPSAGRHKTLIQFDMNTREATWVPSSAHPTTIPISTPKGPTGFTDPVDWRSFWAQVSHCGGGASTLLRLPHSEVRGETITRPELSAILAKLAATPTGSTTADGGRLVSLTTTGRDEDWSVLSQSLAVQQVNTPPPYGVTENEHVIGVFLEASALTQ